MKDEDKLRFELGGGFNKLSESEINKLRMTKLNLINNTYKQKSQYSYYDAINLFCRHIRCMYTNDEVFIQIIVECCNAEVFGWALHQIKDKDLYKYAKEEMEKILLESYNVETMKEYLNIKELPV